MQAPVIHILIDDDGIPRTINRRVKVHMLAKKHRHGVSAGELAQQYDITLADVYAALAYYHDNLPYFEAREQAVAPRIKQGTDDTSRLRDKIEQRLAENADQD